jgi:feruloyl-CoA synthase
VVGLPDANWGETVTAFIVPKTDQQVDSDTIKVFLADKLAKYKIPRVCHIVDSLPHTPTGKVMKFQLREQFK